MNIPTRYLCALGVILFACSGCQQRVASELLGKWEGRPDTAAQQAEREAEKYGDEKQEAPESSAEDEAPTDWESYDVLVVLDFISRTDVEFSMQGDPPIAGTWSVLQSGPSGCTIEVKTPTGADDAEELRRYRLELDQREGELYGFLFTEVGSDRRLGALYFQRPGT